MVHKRVFVAGSEEHLQRAPRPMAGSTAVADAAERPDSLTMILVVLALVASAVGFSLVESKAPPPASTAVVQ